MGTRHLRRRTLGGPQQQAARLRVKLDGLYAAGEEVAQDDGPKWVHVATEGNYQGYAGGKKPFQLTKADFNQAVANLKSHSSYKTDAEGNPVGHVIPWDYNHASELPPGEGELPVVGAPAQAWTLDLEVRNGADGKAQLWALTEFLEPARTYVRAGQYKWASVALVFNAIDPVSGTSVGTMVSSIALTNTPFIEGMEPLVASRQGGAQAPTLQAYRRTFYDSAQSPQDAINLMKEMFGLPETAGVPELMIELNKVQSWFADGMAPLGTDPDYIIGSLRTILGLPALEPAMNVITYAATSVQALVSDQTNGAPAIAPSPDGLPQAGIVPPMMTAARRRKDEDMDLLKTLAGSLGVRESEGAVTDTVKDLVALRAGLCALFGMTMDAGSVLLERAKKSQGIEAKLKAILGALGIEDGDAALANIKDLIEKADTLKAAMPELEGLKIKVKEQEAKSEESDVDEAIAASKLPSTIKPALLLQRRQDPKGFAEQYPKQTIQQQVQNPQHQQLLQKGVTSGGFKVVGGAVVKLAGQNQGQQLQQGETINLSMYPGRNPTARAKAYLASTTANWDKLTNDEQWRRALELKNKPGVVDQPTS